MYGHAASFFLFLLCLSLQTTSAQSPNPYIYWWWMGSRVDSAGLAMNLDSFQTAGFGGVHIIPIYGKKGEKGIPLLSDSFSFYVRQTVQLARQQNLFVDISLGSGWPYGGPDVPEEHRAWQLTPLVARNKWPANPWKVVGYYASADSLNWTLLSESDTAKAAPFRMVMVVKPTFQKVKRPSLGGEGFVIDHFNPEALKYYLRRFEPLLQNSGIRAVYMDSYEVFQANFTPGLPEDFEKEYGYSMLSFLPYLFYSSSRNNVEKARQDYHRLLSEKILDFGRTLSDWAQSQHVELRLQAHGSPTHIVDLHELGSFPETESFGTKADSIAGYQPDPDYSKEAFVEPDFYCFKLATTPRHFDPKARVTCETGT
jgi:hypothetical protein